MDVKICGITNLDDALVAVEAGADLLGFILYPKSPRYIVPAAIARIVARIKADHAPAIRCVGVFVNEPLEVIRAILAEASLDYAQLHGDEPPALLDALPGRAYKALRPATAAEATAQANTFARTAPAHGPRLMVDAYDPAEYGGTGKKADWTAAATLARRHPGLLLAGGLTPDNVAAAIRTVQPWGVDVASGVEASPGHKDHAKVRAFVRHAKQA